MSSNNRKDNCKNQKQAIFFTSNVSPDSVIGLKVRESQQISDILNYRKSEANNKFSNVEAASEKDSINMTKCRKDGINHISDHCIDNNDDQTGKAEKYSFPLLSKTIISKPSYLENIIEEQVDSTKINEYSHILKERKSVDNVNSVPVDNANMTGTENKTKIIDPCENILDENKPKYAFSFFDDQRVQEELFQQNLLAQQLLMKYFKKEEDNEEKNDSVKMKDKTTKKAITLLESISSILRRFHQITEKNKRSSDVYMSSNNPFKMESNLEYAKPFKYQRNYSDSAMNVNLSIPLEGCIRRTRFCYENDFVRDSLTDIRNDSFENIQFLNTKLTHSGNYNKILYKNDSKNLENNFSEEDFEGWNCPILSERYLSLRNLYSCSYLESNKSRYYFQTLPRNSGTMGLKFDNGIDFKVTDEEYKLWLKQNGFVKYTDYSITTNSLPSTKNVSSGAPTHFSVSQASAKLQLVPFHEKSRDSFDNRAFEDINYEKFYQLIIYEHIVVSNCILFFSNYVFAKRLKKLTITDRIFQLIFLVICYFVIVTLNESGVTNIADGVNYRSALKYK